MSRVAFSEAWPERPGPKGKSRLPRYLKYQFDTNIHPDILTLVAFTLTLADGEGIMRKTKLARLLKEAYGSLVDNGHGGLRRKFRKRVRVTHIPIPPKSVYQQCPACLGKGKINCAACNGYRCGKCGYTGRQTCIQCIGEGTILVTPPALQRGSRALRRQR